jgi:hypothetical protein
LGNINKKGGETMKQELIQIIKELREVIDEAKLNITHSEIMDFALKIYITESINKQKQYPKSNYVKNEFKNTNPNTNPLTSKDEPATNSQIWKLKQLGITPNAGLTKRGASQLIKQAESKQ